MNVWCVSNAQSFVKGYIWLRMSLGVYVGVFVFRTFFDFEDDGGIGIEHVGLMWCFYTWWSY